MRVHIKVIAFFGVLFTLVASILSLTLLSGCSHNKNEYGNKGDAESYQIITGIFSPNEIVQPSKYSSLPNVLPSINKDGTFTILSLRQEEPVDSEETAVRRTAWITDYSENGEEIHTEEMPLPGDVEFIHGGTITDDYVYFVYNTVLSVAVYRYDRTTGELISTEEITHMLSVPSLSADYFLSDERGTIYYSDSNTLIVLNPDLSLFFSLEYPFPIKSIARGMDGYVWVQFVNEGLFCSRIEPDKQKLTEPKQYPVSDSGKNPLLINALCTMEDYNFGYYDDTAVWLIYDEKDKTGIEKLVDLVSSGIPRLYAFKDFFYGESGLYPVAILNKERMLIDKYDGQWSSFPVIYNKGEDLHINTIHQIILAHSVELPPRFIDAIKSWNKSHPDTIITCQDYSRYTTVDDRYGGEYQICFDMQLGKLQPDIIYTGTPGIVNSERSVMNQVINSDLYIDLSPYLEKDDKVNFQTLFGCVPRFFGDGNGGVWGITTNFRVQSTIVNRDFLGAIANKDSWTLNDMFDVLDFLPEDVELYYGYSKKWSIEMFMKEGYTYFVKNGTLDFESPIFIRFLEFYKSIPSSWEEWRQKSSISEYTESEAFNNGLLVISTANELGITSYLSCLSFKEAWNEEQNGHIKVMGFATESDNGTRFTPDNCLILTKYSKNPDLCFEIIKSFFFFDESEKSIQMTFALKTTLEEAVEIKLNKTLIEVMGVDMKKRLYDLYDSGGMPLIEYIPEGVFNIINEEISAYCAGIGTSTDCAAKIQSRVSIWLAEHE